MDRLRIQCGNSDMYQRIIEIETIGTRLSISNGLLCITPPHGDSVKLPVKTCSVLILSNPAVSLSSAVISEIAENGGVVVVCNSKWLPVAAFLPYVGMKEQTRVVISQAEMPITLKKRLWKELIVRKIKNHASVLKSAGLAFQPLLELSKAVRSGDTSNIEARAAAYYWRELNLFPKRNRSAKDANILLNYAYTLLASSIARALCASGLNLCLGVHHRNKYNPYCLASDIMEPYRFFAEASVLANMKENDTLSEGISRKEKEFISSYFLERDIRIDREWHSLNSALRKTAVSLAESIQTRDKHLILPEGEIRCG